jgi:hypothetical protein
MHIYDTYVYILYIYDYMYIYMIMYIYIYIHGEFYNIYICLVGGLKHDFYFSHHIGNVIIPFDFHMFQRGVKAPTRCVYMVFFSHMP